MWTCREHAIKTQSGSEVSGQFGTYTEVSSPMVRTVQHAYGPKCLTLMLRYMYSPVARGWKKGHTPPGGRTKRDLFYLKGMGVYFMKRMVVQKLSRYNNSD